MIVRITGQVASVDDDVLILDRDGVCYEVNIPAFARDVLAAKVGQRITLHTIEYYEGSAMGGNMFPRLVGFLEPAEKAFFMEFIKVKGLGYRKSLRAFAQPIKQIASAIETSDIRFLSTLPEIGKRTAEQLVASLRGKLNDFVWGDGETRTSPVIDESAGLNDIQREALEVLMQLGEKRAEAIELIKKVCPTDAKIADPAKIVELVYKRKAGTM